MSRRNLIHCDFDKHSTKFLNLIPELPSVHFYFMNIRSQGIVLRKYYLTVIFLIIRN